MTTMILTAKLNDVDPLAWLADVLARITATPRRRKADFRSFCLGIEAGLGRSLTAA